jgi:hypothetical protein
MATQKQIEANKKNAKNSTGPKTQNGKENASKNSLKHGLTAQKTVIETESQADFDLYRENFLKELAPVTPMESMLAERIIDLSWRLKRSGRIQNQTIDVLQIPKKPSPVSKLAKKLLKRDGFVVEDDEEETNNLPLGRLAIKDFSNNRVLEKLLIYERRLEHSLYRTVIEYQRLNLVRSLNPECQSPLKEMGNYCSKVAHTT